MKKGKLLKALISFVITAASIISASAADTGFVTWEDLRSIDFEAATIPSGIGIEGANWNVADNGSAKGFLSVKGKQNEWSKVRIRGFEDSADNKYTSLEFKVMLDEMVHDYAFSMRDTAQVNTGTNWVPGYAMGYCYFDKNGKFVYTKKSATGIANNYEDEGTYGEEYFGVSEKTYAADTWYTVKMVADKVSKQTSFYVDGEYIGQTTKWDSNVETGTVGALVIEGTHIDTALSEIYVDDVKVKSADTIAANYNTAVNYDFENTKPSVTAGSMTDGAYTYNQAWYSYITIANDKISGAKSSDVAILSMDIYNSEIKRNYTYQLKSADETPVNLAAFFFDSYGNFVMVRNHAMAETTDYKTADEYGTYFTLYPGCVAEKWYNVTVVIDRTTKISKVYLDGNYVGESWGNDSNPAIKNNSECVIKQLAIREIASTEKPMKLDNLNLSYPASETEISKMVVFCADGTSYECPTTEKISMKAEKIELYFENGTPDYTTVSSSYMGCTYKDSENTTKWLSSIMSYDEERNVVVIDIKERLSRDTSYNFYAYLKGNDGLEMPWYSAQFTTKSADGIYVDYFKLVDAQGNAVDTSNLKTGDVVYADVSVMNYTDKAQDIVFVMNSCDGNRLSAVDFGGGVMGAGESIKFDETSENPIMITIGDEKKLSLNGYIWESFETLEPLADYFKF